jgi:hypothetical protein
MKNRKNAVSRRRFLARLAATGAAASPLLYHGPQLLEAQANRGLAPTDVRIIGAPGPASGPKRLIEPSDFSYLGCFKIPTAVPNGGDTTWGSGLTHRYVNGQLRFIFSAWNGPLYEVSAPGLGALPKVAPTAAVVRAWDAAGVLPGQLLGIFWDEIDQRLYWSGGSLYNTTSPYDPVVGFSTLNGSTGAVTKRGPWGLNNYSCKMAMGGVLAIPEWFANSYCQGRRLGAGFGGYFSILAVGPISFGPSLTAFSPGALDAATQGTSIAHTPLVGYPNLAPSRCRRDPDYHSDFGGDINPVNGVGYWTWADWLYQAGTWIDTPTKSGLLFLPTLGNGRVWYETSTLHAARGSHAWYIYDPLSVAEVAKGQPQWQPQPARQTLVQYPGVTYPLAGWADGPHELLNGVSYDSAAQRLYVSIRHAQGFYPGSEQVVYAYQVS